MVDQFSFLHWEETSLKIGRDCEHMTFFGVSSKWLLFLIYSNCVSFLPFLTYLPSFLSFTYSLLSLFLTFLILYFSYSIFAYSLLSLFLTFLNPYFHFPPFLSLSCPFLVSFSFPFFILFFSILKHFLTCSKPLWCDLMQSYQFTSDMT